MDYWRHCFYDAHRPIEKKVGRNVGIIEMTDSMNSESKNDLQRFIELIQAINKRPGMFGVSKVEHVQLVILGFTRGAPYNESVSGFISELDQFVRNNYGENKEFQWVKLIRLYCGGDWDSLKQFSRLFDEFLEARNGAD